MAHAEVVIVKDADKKQLSFLKRQIASGRPLNAHAAATFERLTGRPYVYGSTGFEGGEDVPQAAVPAAYNMDLASIRVSRRRDVAAAGGGGSAPPAATRSGVRGGGATAPGRGASAAPAPPSPAVKELRKVNKKLRQIQALQDGVALGRLLTPEEAAKVASRGELEARRDALTQGISR